jgi:transcriptional regulator with XRE-family HTH domain
MNDPNDFAFWLRRQRELRGISIRQIADRTKVAAALFEALERGDLSRWPAGLYRRAFVRGYAQAIGLDPDDVVQDFVRLFPMSEDTRLTEIFAPRVAIPPDESPLRLELAPPPLSLTKDPAVWRSVALDLAFVLGFGLLGWLAAGAMGLWCSTAVTSVVFHVAGLLGIRSPWPARFFRRDREHESTVPEQSGAHVLEM